MNSIKNHIKALAKEKNMNVVELARSMEMTDQNLYKLFRHGTIKLNQLEKIAETLQCTVQELIPLEESKPGNHNVSEGSEVIQNSIAKNNFFSGDKTEIVRLQTENEHLKATVEKQDKEIEFLRNQLSK